MKLAKVIGTVVATQKHESLKNTRLLMIQPLDDDLKPVGNQQAAVDTVSAAPGQLVYITLSVEGAMALDVPFAPVDVVITGIVDDVNQEMNEIVNKTKIFVEDK